MAGSDKNGVKDNVNGLTIRSRVQFQTQVKKDAFISALRKVATVSVACDIANVSRAIVYEWRNEDDSFAERWDNALAYAFEALESATYLKVAKVLQEDTKRVSMPEARLIEMFLAGAKPEKYRQRGIEIDNSVNTANLTIDWSQVPQDVFDAFKRNEITLEDVYQRTLLVNAQQKTPSSDEGV